MTCYANVYLLSAVRLLYVATSLYLYIGLSANIWYVLPMLAVTILFDLVDTELYYQLYQEKIILGYGIRKKVVIFSDVYHINTSDTIMQQ